MEEVRGGKQSGVSCRTLGPANNSFASRRNASFPAGVHAVDGSKPSRGALTDSPGSVWSKTASLKQDSPSRVLVVQLVKLIRCHSRIVVIIFSLSFFFFFGSKVSQRHTLAHSHTRTSPPHIQSLVNKLRWRKVGSFAPGGKIPDFRNARRRQRNEGTGVGPRCSLKKCQSLNASAA